jgi:hypothetical protein
MQSPGSLEREPTTSRSFFQGPGRRPRGARGATGGVAFADLIGTAGTPPVDMRIQRALVDFYERGCRIEELLALWPLLRSLGLAKIPLAKARAACQRLFDNVQSHSIEGREGMLEGLDRRHGSEVARVARLLLPGWPRELSPADALARFESVRGRLALAEPAGWPVLLPIPPAGADSRGSRSRPPGELRVSPGRTRSSSGPIRASGPRGASPAAGSATTPGGSSTSRAGSRSASPRETTGRPLSAGSCARSPGTRGAGSYSARRASARRIPSSSWPRIPGWSA